jgi:hypothetical protein
VGRLAAWRDAAPIRRLGGTPLLIDGVAISARVALRLSNFGFFLEILYLT